MSARRRNEPTKKKSRGRGKPASTRAPSDRGRQPPATARPVRGKRPPSTRERAGTVIIVLSLLYVVFVGFWFLNYLPWLMSGPAGHPKAGLSYQLAHAPDLWHLLLALWSLILAALLTIWPFAGVAGGTYLRITGRRRRMGK